MKKWIPTGCLSCPQWQGQSFNLKRESRKESWRVRGESLTSPLEVRPGKKVGACCPNWEAATWVPLLKGDLQGGWGWRLWPSFSLSEAVLLASGLTFRKKIWVCFEERKGTNQNPPPTPTSAWFPLIPWRPSKSNSCCFTPDLQVFSKCLLWWTLRGI